MKKQFFSIVFFAVIACLWTACKDDVANAGRSVLGPSDEIVVLADTFPLHSVIDSCEAIISQADSFLLGELETDYGLLRASILTQLACPEGYSYPEGATIDSVCLFMYYSSWVGNGYSPLAINAYLMDKNTFRYSGTYPTDLNIADYCTRDKSILENHRIVVATEKLDSVQNSDGTYIPMLRMRLNDDFEQYFWGIQSFTTQEDFNRQFKGILVETSFGSSTVLNVSDLAMGVYYHFSYSKAGRDTIVNDMKIFYANSEVRTVNHLLYRDKAEWIESLQADSDLCNYVVAPAGVYTRLSFPMARMADTIVSHLIESISPEGDTIIKRPYVNLAQVRVDVLNVFSGSSADVTRNDWLQPAGYMLLIKEESLDRFFAKKELPSDTCALLCALTQGTDSAGNTIYYYSYDLSDFLTLHIRERLMGDTTRGDELNMLLVPVTVETTTTSSATGISAVRQQQTLSATQIRSAQNGMNLKLVYSGF